jgi:hypothetical protein
MGYGLDGQVSISGTANDFSLLHNVQTGSWAYLASYPVSIMGFSKG